ncbi:carboxypeptidase-like regulatory domain-containing protein [Bacillus sp. SCS-153A]|uniref:carboxypeptidase-like regulatory domain-containing protein n=1 Tax=Rossellomorea sedimentorum TaxID=3115294 RepID=UPI003905E0F0
MKKLNKKFFRVLAMLGIIFSLCVPSAGFATEKSYEPAQKEIPFPSESRSTFSAFSFMSMQEGEIGNNLVRANIGNDGRFSAGLKAVENSDWYRIIYGGYDGWSGWTGTSFTSLKIDGEDKVFGNYEYGEFLQAPTNVNDQTNQAVWKSGDISVKQVLKSTINPATGIDDAIQVRYTMTNTGETDHDVGLRIMIDTMVGNNDSAPFKVPVENSIESIDYQKQFVGDEVPEFWQAFQSFDNPDISSQYTMGGENSTKPDRFVIANWGSIMSTIWDYQVPETQSRTGDSAVGMWWEPVTLAPGETKTITTYYGRPGVGGSQTLLLSGKQKLTASEWTSGSTNIIAYLNNNTGRELNNVNLRIVPSEGITLVDNDDMQVIGPVAERETTQTAWRVQPTRSGTHYVTVEAFEEGISSPFATTEFQIIADEPVVPANVSIGNSRGEDRNGNPIAGRTSPLTINASYPDATRVTLRATDSNSSTYEAEMTSENSGDWTHSFIPSQYGLWGSPLVIQLIPEYQDGSTGEPQGFEIVLIDPSGIVYNAEKATINQDPDLNRNGERPLPLDWELPGATVVLQYYDPALESWVIMTNEAYPGMLSPIENPQVTGEDGRYAWDVAEGRYRVVVSRPGFETKTSEEVNVPPPVLDLHVGLTPTDRVAPTVSYEGVENNKTYTGPVSIQLQAADDEAGVRTISYRVDGGEEVNSSDDNFNISVNDTGNHTVEVTVLDHAGNEVNERIEFSIQEELPEGDILTVLSQAIEKANEINSNMKESLDDLNAGHASAEVESAVANAISVNEEVQGLITQAKVLLQEQPLSSALLPLLEMQLRMAEDQSVVTDLKLRAAQQKITDGRPLTEVSSDLKSAQNANKKCKASLQYVASYLVMVLLR